MNKISNRDDAGVLLTVKQVAALSNLGTGTVRRLAEQAGAVRRIGRIYRIKRDDFFTYLDNFYTSE